LIGGWQFDESMIFTYPYYRLIFDERRADPNIMVQGKDNMSVEAMRDELKGSMRNLRRLGPREEDDFSLNSVSDFSKSVGGFFSSVTLGGWFIDYLA
jgi:putative ABC transport system permease protein